MHETLKQELCSEVRSRLLDLTDAKVNNVFGAEACATLLLFKIQKLYWKTMKSFLLYLNIITKEELKDVNEEKETKGPTTVNNSLFVGSTAELQKFLKQNDKA